jgi:hypothetical protein
MKIQNPMTNLFGNHPENQCASSDEKICSQQPLKNN